MKTFKTIFSFTGSQAGLKARRAMAQYEKLGITNMTVTASGEYLAGDFHVLLDNKEIEKIGDALIHVMTSSGKPQTLAHTPESIVSVSCYMQGEEVDPLEEF